MRFTRNAFRVEGHTLRLTKVGAIPVTWSRELPAEPGSVTILHEGHSRALLRQLRGGGGAANTGDQRQEWRHGSGLGIPGRHLGG